MLTLNVLTETKYVIFSFPSRMRGFAFHFGTMSQRSDMSNYLRKCRWLLLRLFKNCINGLALDESDNGVDCPPNSAVSAYGWLCHWFSLGFLAYWFHFFTFTQLHTLGLNTILNLQREKEGKKNGERTNFLFFIVNFGHYSKILEWLGLALPIIQTFRLNTSLAAASLG